MEPFEDFRKELDSLRNRKTSFNSLSDEEKEIILYARNGNNPVSYVNLAQYMSKRFGKKYSRSTIQQWFIELSKNTSE